MTRRQRRLPKFLEAGELGALLAVAHESSPRDYAIMLTMAKAGLRVSEVCTLEWRDVSEKRLLVRQGKGSKDRMVPLHYRLKTAIEELPKRREMGSTPVFLSRTGRRLTRRAIQFLMERLASRAGIDREKAHPHSARHTFAVNLLEKGADIRTLQKLLGHRSISTTQTYLDLTDRHMEAAIGLLD